MTQSAYWDNVTGTADAHGATATFVASYKSININELVSYADKHVGENVIVTGQVFNIINSQTLQIMLPTYDAVYVELDPSTTLDQVYKNDYVTIYGTVAGYAEGTNLFGAGLREPELTNAVVLKR